MSKKFFVTVAEHVRESAEPFTEYQLSILADALESINPNFNRPLWLAYARGEVTAKGKKK